MKKTRKLLSVVLSVLIVMASMPMMYTATAASGTIDNPTTAVSSSGVYSRDDAAKLNIDVENTSYTFYQTMDDEYFTYTQSVNLQQRNDVPTGGRTFTFEGVSFYTGSTCIDTSVDTYDSTTGYGENSTAIEAPVITNNTTSDFVATFAPIDSWAATNSNATSLASKPENVILAGSAVDLTGCKNYSWGHTYTIKGHSASTQGEVNTGYYESYKWNWVTSDASASYELRLKTSIRIIDARVLAAELAEAEEVVANPDNYSAAYVSANQAVLNDIPADLKNFSAVYSQDVVNSYADLLASIPEDSADYTEYNATYAEYIAFTNDEGIYSAQSYQAYIAEINSINAGLSKTLTSSEQATVDDATQAIKDAEELLVIEFPGTGSTTNSDIEDLSPWVENEFNFIQIEDDQVLAFTQDWTMYRGTNSSNRMFYITLDTTDANTASFAPRFTTDCVTTLTSLSAGAIEGTLSNQMVFTNWLKVDANGNPDPEHEAIVDGLINPDYAGFQSGETYYFENGLSFVGMSASESGAKTYTYVQKVYINWTSWAVVTTINHYNSTTYSTTLNITDARALANAYNEAVEEIANPGLHSVSYMTELQKIVDSVPQDMVNGTKYYTQAEVDAYYEAFIVLSESKADYSALETAYERVEAILNNPDAYSGDTLAAAQAALADADALDKNLIDSVSNREAIAAVTATLNSVADNAEAIADYTTYNQYMDIVDGLKPTDYTGDAYSEFMAVVDSVKASTPLDLGTSDQATVDAACQTLLDAYLKLTGGTITDPDSVGDAFTQDAITGEYTNGVIKFTLNYPEYNFTQTINDEKLSIKTELTISSADSSKVVNLTSLKISSLDSTELASLDTTGNCYNSDSVTINNAENLFIVPNVQYNVVQGVDLLLDANGTQYADTNGDLAWFTTWQNTAGVPLSTDGLINESTTLTTEDSSATAEFIFASAGGGDTETKLRSYTYVLRLAWTEDGVEHHAHIPVTFNISDARSLRSTYYSYMDFINAGNDGAYTAASFQAAADIMASVNIDVVNGNGYYTQEEINAESAKLGQALASLQTKADYSQLDSLVEQAKAMLSDSTVTYTDATRTALEEAIAAAESVNRDISAADEEANGTIASAVAGLQSAINGAQVKADYTEFDAVVDELENIVNNPDDYTEETVQNAQDALDNIVAGTDKDLPSTEQDTLDEITSNLQDVVDSAEKKADYTDYNNAKAEADSLVNDDGNGNPIYNEDAFKAYKEAVENVDTALDKDLPATEQETVNNAVTELENLKAELENNKNADYTDFNTAKDALEEIVNAPAGTYTDETVQKAQDALDAANQVPANMVVGENNANQDIIDAATDAMQNVIDSAEKKADYTDFDAAKDALEEIVNAPAGTYTDETVQKAQEALEAANQVPADMVVGENNANQDIIDEATQAMQDVIDSAEKKADYTDFDAVVDELENIVNNPDDYTSDTVEKAQDALDNIVAGTDKDLPVSEQPTLDEITSNLQDVVGSAEKKADYTDYNNAKSEADSLVNDDGNGNPVYDEDAFNAYKEAVENIDTALDKDLPESEQSVVDDATQSLEELKVALEEKKIYTVTFIGANGETLSTESYVNGSAFGTISAPALPEATETMAYVGWLNADVFMTAESVLTGDVVLTVASEHKKLLPNTDSTVSINEETGYVTGINKDTTVAQLKAQLQNDETVVEIKHYTGTELADESLVGTGSTITLKSKYTGVVYETRTIIIYGDLDGDGDVDADDRAIANETSVDNIVFAEDQAYFFLANDVCADGYLDVLDAWLIGRISRNQRTVISVE